MNIELLFTFLLCVLGPSAALTRQYIFVEESLNWTEALTFCRQNYTDLASISSVKEMLYRPQTSSNTSSNTSSYAWIGPTTNSWRWSGGGSLGQFQKWWSGQPASGQCVYMDSQGSWGTLGCSYGLYFLCYTASVPKTYTLVQSSISWWGAVSYCRQYYTDLALVENAAETTAMTSVMDKSHGTWIGLYQGWSDSTMPSFTNSARGRSLGSGPRCVAEDPSHLWTDLTCDTRLPFYCYNGVTTTTTAPTTTAVKPVPEKKKSSVMKMEFLSDRDLTDPTNQSILTQIETELQKRGHVRAKVLWKKVPQKKKKSEL